MSGDATRLKLVVPDGDAHTQMTMGERWGEATEQVDGFSAVTDAHVWLDARGDTETSTLSALSKGEEGGSPAGQLLMQSLGQNLLFAAEKNVVFASNGSALFASGGGVKAIAGHGGMEAITNVDPDDETHSSAHAAAYAEHLGEVADGWAYLDTAMAVGLIGLDVALAIADCKAGSDSLTTGNALMAAGSLANLAGGAVNVAGLDPGGEWSDEVDLPGMNLHAEGSIMMATTGFGSFFAGAGLLFAGMYTNMLGYMTVGVVGAASAGLSGLYSAAVEGGTLDVTGNRTASLSARTGELSLVGATVNVGATLDKQSASQVPTTQVKAEALQSLEMTSTNIASETKGDLGLSADVIQVQSDQKVVLDGGTYSVEVSASGITLQVKSGPVKLSVDALSATLDCQGISGVKVDKNRAILGASETVKIEIGSDGSGLLCAPTFSFL